MMRSGNRRDREGEDPMDDNRFDAFARSVGSIVPRRTIARALAGIGIGAVTRFPVWLVPEQAAAQCVNLGKSCKKNGKRRRCCGGAKCKGGRCKCTGGKEVCGAKCVDLMTDPRNCGRCGLICVSDKCRHGACTCDPFNNQCPTEIDGQCTCGAVVVAEGFEAARVDRNSACDLDRPCESDDTCPPGSVCLLGCSDPPDPQPKRCSKPCIPV